MATGLSRVGIKVDTSQIGQAEIKINGLGNALDKLARRAKKVEPPKFRKNAVRKLKNTVYALGESILLNMSWNTQVGDIDKLVAGYAKGATGVQRLYRQLYETRQDRYGLPVDVGYHAGSYQYSKARIPQFISEIRERDEMLADFKSDFMREFKLGDVFYITAQGPAFKLMEAGVIGQAEGIIKPTIQSVMRTYAFDMQQAYNASAR